MITEEEKIQFVKELVKTKGNCFSAMNSVGKHVYGEWRCVDHCNIRKDGESCMDLKNISRRAINYNKAIKLKELEQL
jgi:hypothetical protein